jgi:hypothetical protein
MDMSRYDEAVSALPDIVATLRRLPGNQSYLTGLDRTNGRTMAVSTWDTEDHAHFASDAAPDLASRLQAVGLQVESTEFFEVTTPT